MVAVLTLVSKRKIYSRFCNAHRIQEEIEIFEFWWDVEDGIEYNYILTLQKIWLFITSASVGGIDESKAACNAEVNISSEKRWR